MPDLLGLGSFAHVFIYESINFLTEGDMVAFGSKAALYQWRVN